MSWPYLELVAEIRLINFGLWEHFSGNLLEALVAHPPRDGSGISSEAGDGHTNMVVNGKDLLLMTRSGEE